MVPPFDPDRMEDLKQARLALESLVLEQAIERMTPEKLSDMEAILAAAPEDGGGLPDLKQNYDFHFALYRQSGSEVLLPLVEALSQTLVDHAKATAAAAAVPYLYFERRCRKEDLIRQMLTEKGRDPATVPISLWQSTEDTTQLRRYRDLGVTRVVVSLVLRDHKPAMIAIADNGSGMAAADLDRAASLAKDPRKQDGTRVVIEIIDDGRHRGGSDRLPGFAHPGDARHRKDG